MNTPLRRRTVNHTPHTLPRQRPFPSLIPILLAFSFALLTLFAIGSLHVAHAQQPNPPNQPARGLVYDGLVKSDRADCPNGYLIRVPTRKKPLCTHGPDPIPFGETRESSVAPLAENLAAAQVVCDGDGQSGKRIQVLYVRASDRPDRYAEYVNSIQQWAAGADEIYNLSAAETGGERHVRYVHDASCLPVIENLILSPTGDDSFANTVVEMMNLGYSRPDRNYLLFVDAGTYCGIANIVGDDSPDATNQNNTGSRYARVDARCWGAWVAAHETMHTIGGVQMSAPHTTGGWHCFDENDVMCYQDSSTAPAMQYVCDSTHEYRFDCNHDDYFSTNPPRRSYLATHWNAANSQFLFAPLKPLLVNATVTGKMTSGKFVATDTFKRGEKVVYRMKIQSGTGEAVSGALTSLEVIRADGSAVCAATVTSDTSGTAQSSCALGKNAPLGEWKVRVTNLEKSGYKFEPNANAEHLFNVIAK